MKDAQSIPLDRIDTGARIRGSYDRPVAALAASIRDGAEAGTGHDGLLSPIAVRKQGEHYALISGLHRLRAVEALERTEIAAFVLDVDDVKAALLELEENLVRADLTVLDRALFVKRFREVFEAEHGAINPKGGRPEKNSGNLPLFSEAAVERLSMSEDKLKRSLRIANGLRREAVGLLRETGWDDNQSALLALCGVPPDDQVAIVERLLDPDNGLDTVSDAIAGQLPEGSPAERWHEKMMKGLNADVRWRRRFYAQVLAEDYDLVEEMLELRGLRIVEGTKA